MGSGERVNALSTDEVEEQSHGRHVLFGPLRMQATELMEKGRTDFHWVLTVRLHTYVDVTG